MKNHDFQDFSWFSLPSQQNLPRKLQSAKIMKNSNVTKKRPHCPSDNGTCFWFCSIFHDVCFFVVFWAENVCWEVKSHGKSWMKSMTSVHYFSQSPPPNHDFHDFHVFKWFFMILGWQWGLLLWQWDLFLMIDVLLWQWDLSFRSALILHDFCFSSFSVAKHVFVSGSEMKKHEQFMIFHDCHPKSWKLMKSGECTRFPLFFMISWFFMKSRKRWEF